MNKPKTCSVLFDAGPDSPETEPGIMVDMIEQAAYDKLESELKQAKARIDQLLTSMALDYVPFDAVTEWQLEGRIKSLNEEIERYKAALEMALACVGPTEGPQTRKDCDSILRGVK